MEQYYLVVCPHCNQQRTTIIRQGNIIGKLRECFHCHKYFIINKINIVKRLK